MKNLGNLRVSQYPPLLTGGYNLHKGSKKLENLTFVPALTEKNNCFLIDWLTFTAHGDTVDYLKWLLGLDDPSIPWQEEVKFRNGYPVQCYWQGITISYGADDERYYADASKARSDMGICVNLSGTGCRTFETYGHGDWFRLFSYLYKEHSSQVHLKWYNITRVDLAYDDHIGILDISTVEHAVRERNYISRSKYSEITWSDDQTHDIQGTTVQIGSDKSEIKIRIYDKAAERGFKDRHWIRCEMQLRDDRATSACAQIALGNSIGVLTSGVLRNYLKFVEPVSDSNKSRWHISPWWDRMLLDMRAITLWSAPGEPYNFSKTEYWLVKQYGQAVVVFDIIRNSESLLEVCKKQFPLEKLAKKYQSLIYEYGVEHGISISFSESAPSAD